MSDGTIERQNDDGSVTIFASGAGNPYYREYLEWVAAGNMPEPADPEPEPVDPGPSLADRVEAAETIIDLLLMEGE